MLRLRIPVRARDHMRGPARAAVTLVEYGDFQCSFCGQAFWVLRDLEVRYSRDLRFVFRNFPLAELHPLAMAAAEAAEAANAQGKFWEMHDLLYKNQPDFEPDDLVAYAIELGLDIDEFTADLENHRHRDRVREDFLGGVRSGVNGTPCLFLNDDRFNGPAEESWLSRAIDAARSHRHATH